MPKTRINSLTQTDDAACDETSKHVFYIDIFYESLFSLLFLIKIAKALRRRKISAKARKQHNDVEIFEEEQQSIEDYRVITFACVHLFLPDFYSSAMIIKAKKVNF